MNRSCQCPPCYTRGPSRCARAQDGGTIPWAVPYTGNRAFNGGGGGFDSFFGVGRSGKTAQLTGPLISHYELCLRVSLGRILGVPSIEPFLGEGGGSSQGALSTPLPPQLKARLPQQGTSTHCGQAPDRLWPTAGGMPAPATDRCLAAFFRTIPRGGRLTNGVGRSTDEDWPVVTGGWRLAVDPQPPFLGQYK